jgi:peptide deformylase
LNWEEGEGSFAGYLCESRVFLLTFVLLSSPQVNSEVSEEEIASGSIQKLAKEMFLVMYAANGVGLAAPQVGVNKRVMVYNPSGDKTKWMEETVFVNPKVTTTSEARSVEEEGCLSFPGMQGKVERPKWIKVEGVSLKGKKLKKKFTGFEARVFQHEYDHLDGVCYIDRLVDDNERDSVSPVLEELVSGFEGEGAKVGFREGLGVTGLDASEGAATAEANAK